VFFEVFGGYVRASYKGLLADLMKRGVRAELCGGDRESAPLGKR